ncbi:unnamed protein product [Peronospora destructor]|uniref:Transmembrane 9 superfamily member n=1 Tax=Peronospora destructor TaxID=86335 RepID=A0AAV0U949_9STRA|nr:unnamed protein product [Peronospora destructor]
MWTKSVMSMALAAFLAAQEASAAFYVPGVAPESWAAGDVVRLNVNKITSTKTLVPYEYYYLPYCKPAFITEQQENLGRDYGW